MPNTRIEQENKELKKLVSVNEEACEFYESACEHVTNEQLRDSFRNLESLHRNIVINLQQKIRLNGGNPDHFEAIGGQYPGGWGELMTTFDNDIDETLIMYLEEAENRCLKYFNDTLQSEKVNPDTLPLLTHELSALEKSRDYMKALKSCLFQH